MTVLLAFAFLLSACPLGRGSHKLGEACSTDTACAESRCAAGLCTRACKADADCASAAVKMLCKGNTKSGTNPLAFGVCSVP